jgi:hypothetical protein
MANYMTRVTALLAGQSLEQIGRGAVEFGPAEPGGGEARKNH